MLALPIGITNGLEFIEGWLYHTEAKHTVCIKFVEEATEYEAKILHEHEVTDLEIIRGCTGTNQCLFVGLYLHKTVATLEPGVSPGKISSPLES